MLQIDNRTPFAAELALLANEDGIDTLYTIVKATFKVGKDWVLADEQVPPQIADEYHVEPLTSSLKAASDFHIGKAATDIIMLGSACAREGYPVKGLDVDLYVEKLHKKVRVFGDRRWDRGRISSAEPFEKMPLIYENAYGGAHFDGETLIESEVRNPVGRGFLGNRSISVLDGTVLPNLENPEKLINHPGDKVTPSCFSFVAPNWRPRADYAGTYDQHWQETRAPFLPKDFQRQFLNSASEGLVYSGFMSGGERIKITNMHPTGDLMFQLPAVNLKCGFKVGKQMIDRPCVLETLILEPNDLTVSLVWRSAFIADKNARKVDDVLITLIR
ncbi:hypothetical protein TDB9533_03533 [Thalassocella blandensis]|nr:hypothetical protein TDB9533_03533 [Thalassocella blandensis]